MIQEWFSLLSPALQDRTILLLNHVISREPHAMARLSPFAGRALILHLRAWPALLPAMPDLALGLTAAGLFERVDAEAIQGEVLRIELDASNPALLALASLTGTKPQVTVQGDAALAGEINWLMENLRWDLEDDLAGFLSPAVAHQLASFAKAAGAGLAALARTAASFAPGGRGAA